MEKASTAGADEIRLRVLSPHSVGRLQHFDVEICLNGNRVLDGLTEKSLDKKDTFECQAFNVWGRLTKLDAQANLFL